MKHVAALLLALLLLPACGQAGVVAETTAETFAATTTQAPTITEEETITEAPTTTRATITGKDVTYRTLDLDDKKNADMKKWFDGWFADYNREKEYIPEQLLEQTILEQLEENLEYEYSDTVYPICTALDDRFVFIDWIDYKWLVAQEIYDKQERKSIPFDALPLHAMTPIAVVNDTVYMKNMNDDGPYYEEYCGELNLLAYDLKDLRQGIPFKGKDLLADIPHEPALCVWMSELTNDGRYFIVSDVDSLRVFDLKAKELALQLSATLLGLTRHTQRFTYRWNEDKDSRSLFTWYAGKLYWIPIEWVGHPGDLCHLIGDHIIEITLP